MVTKQNWDIARRKGDGCFSRGMEWILERNSAKNKNLLTRPKPILLIFTH
jgi:hypothetical protein